MFYISTTWYQQGVPNKISDKCTNNFSHTAVFILICRGLPKRQQCSSSSSSRTKVPLLTFKISLQLLITKLTIQYFNWWRNGIQFNLISYRVKSLGHQNWKLAASSDTLCLCLTLNGSLAQNIISIYAHHTLV